mmetsp:Transcript_54638/g.74702  ORF Transcript_54638/g.74702 Transcript_54638/m.74702 type:complete len:148 (+) Transcript_54638:152-595(+)
MAASSVSSNLSDGQLSNEKIEQLFRKFDTSDDGYIESGELKMALQEGENCHGDAEIYDMIKKFDKDQDGQVSLEEFKEVMKLAQEDVPPILKGIFDVGHFFSDRIQDIARGTEELGNGIAKGTEELGNGIAKGTEELGNGIGKLFGL